MQFTPFFLPIFGYLTCVNLKKLEKKAFNEKNKDCKTEIWKKMPIKILKNLFS